MISLSQLNLWDGLTENILHVIVSMKYFTIVAASLIFDVTASCHIRLSDMTKCLSVYWYLTSSQAPVSAASTKRSFRSNGANSFTQVHFSCRVSKVGIANDSIMNQVISKANPSQLCQNKNLPS